jgi:uncharacterized membrane protein YfhO
MMTIALAGADTAPSHLLVAENWYKDWKAEVDGEPATVRRADHTFLSVDLPPGAREVRLQFDSAIYSKGKVISAISLLVAVLMVVIPIAMSSRRTKE